MNCIPILLLAIQFPPSEKEAQNFLTNLISPSTTIVISYSPQTDIYIGENPFKDFDENVFIGERTTLQSTCNTDGKWVEIHEYVFYWFDIFTTPFVRADVYTIYSIENGSKKIHWSFMKMNKI